MHTSVLLDESIKYLDLKDDSIVIDCTLGYGGHSSRILERVKNGFLYAFDQDEEAIEKASKRLSKIGDNFKIIDKNFINLDLVSENVDAIIFDLGVSSPQLDEDYRGFSYRKDAKLDMRMDRRQVLSAYNVVNEYSYEKLNEVFKKYGEEKYSSAIARSIVKYREDKKIETTLELAEIIKMSVPIKYRKKSHPARKVFQAIRIEVNDELNVFEIALRKALDKLNPGGRISVITFHSLEDRICKNIFKEVSEVKKELRDLPVIPDEYKPKYRIIKNVKPSAEEIEKNKRARSSMLRVIERI